MNRQQKSGIISRTDRRPARCRTQGWGIFDKRGLLNEEKSLLSNNRHVEDPRLQTSGMTPYLITETAQGFTPALVTPTLRAAHCAGYSAGKQQGFTLIELLVVVLIIGILAAVALPQYQKAVSKARFVQLQTAGNALIQSYESYVLANGKDPSTFADFDVLPFQGTLNNSKTEIANSKLQCYRNENYPEIACLWKGEENIKFLYFFPTHSNASKRGKRICRGYSDLANKVCLS